MIRFLRSIFKIPVIFLLFFPVMFIAKKSEAQAKFSVVCPQKKIGKDDVLHIKFKVENAESVDNITPPAFKNFTIVSGPNQERSQSNINGKISGYVALGYTLAPTATGKFTIGPATAIADGKNFTTNPITIQVVKGSVTQSQPNNPQQNLPAFPNLNFSFPSAPVSHLFDDYILKPKENLKKKIAENLFLKLHVDKKSCYVGEPIVASYQLYTRTWSRTSDWQWPTFNGFSVTDLDFNRNSTLEKYNGRKYKVDTCRKLELYPLQSGNLVLGSMSASNEVTFVKAEYASRQNGFYGQGAIPPEGLVDTNLTLKSTPEIITVKPLPEKNKPQNFRGAVGDFSITAALEKNKFTTDDAGTLKLVISGKGNIQLINAPVINWPKGIDGYEAKVKDNVDRKQVPMQGSKTFSYPFTVSKAGKYTIDSIEFSYFDPSSSTYKNLYTGQLQVIITKGKGIPTHSLSASDSADASGFISTRTEIIAGIILVLLAILILFFVLMKKNKSRDNLEKNIEVDDLKNEAETFSAEKEKKEFIIPENPLSAAHEKLIAQDSAGFYHSLDASLKKYLASKFNMPVSELSKKRLNEELDKCNVSLNTSLMLTSLMEEVEMNLYAPPSNATQLHSVFEKASEVVSLLDKQVYKKEN